MKKRVVPNIFLQNLFELWEKKDPVKNYEQYLLQQNVLSAADIENIKAELKEKIEQELATGFNTRPVIADTEEEMNDVYAEAVNSGQSTAVRIIDNSQHPFIRPEIASSEKRMIDAIREGLASKYATT